MSILSFVVLVGTSLSQVPASAQATPCRGATCEWKDPYTTHCAADDRLVSVEYFQFGANGGRVEEHYSPSCAANWAVVRIYSGSIEPVDVFIQDTDPYTLGSVWYPSSGKIGTRPGDRYAWKHTPMIDGRQVNCAVALQAGSPSYSRTAPCI
ncbi:YjfA family protein [Nonomuraea gerenzanensis]|nr:YjfA family protein [Nonomuraea gerenzanensis]